MLTMFQKVCFRHGVPAVSWLSVRKTGMDKDAWMAAVGAVGGKKGPDRMEGSL